MRGPAGKRWRRGQRPDSAESWEKLGLHSHVPVRVVIWSATYMFVNVIVAPPWKGATGKVGRPLRRPPHPAWDAAAQTAGGRGGGKK